MKSRTRIYYTEEQKTLMWDRWQEGESISSIAIKSDAVCRIGCRLSQIKRIPWYSCCE